jgi:hypothetical protein
MNTTASHIASLTLSLALAAGSAHAATVRRQIAARAQGEVHISNVSGSILIRGWNKPAVSVTAELTNGRQRLRLRGGNGRTRVCVTNSATSCSWSNFSGRAHPARLVVYVPRDSEIDAAGVSADIRSRGITGVQHLHTVSGAIDAQLGARNDVVKSVSGTIRLQGSGQDGTLRVATISGDLRVTNVAGELDARTINGRLTAQISSARSVRLHTTSGAIGLHADLARGGRVDAQTISGHQTIRVAAAAGYGYTVKSFSGHIENCFGVRARHPQYGPGSRLDGTRGAGDGRVRLKSLSGGISLCDH